MKKVGILTLGCRVNQYESDAISELLSKKGFEVCSFDDDCDIYLINTCSVTAESDSKSRKAIRRAIRQRETTGCKVAVIGCFVQGATKEYPELLEADFIAGNRNKASVAENVERLLSGERLDMRESLEGAPYENLTIDSRRYVKAYVKIEDGCNNFCSYCYVPFVRGRVRSRKKEDIISEVSRLVDRGYREIILTGIETSSYGEDRDEKEPLLSLVEELQKKCHVERLRFGSLHPSYFTEERVKRLSSIEGVMSHFHLSVQSASTSVLEKMGRHYNRETLYGAVENIRRHFEDVNLSCDMICGFPEETDRDFEDSLRFVEDAEILHTHVFPYSQREGTRASKMQEVKTFVKHERARLMTKKAEEIHRRIFDKNIGREYNMMVEFFKNGKALGYTENFLNLSIPIPGNCEKGDIVRVKITPDMDR